MALIKCGECGAEVSDSAAACPMCGAPMQKPRSGFPPWLMAVGFVVGLFVLFGAINANSPEAKARIQDRLAIEACWKDHARASLTPDEKRFIAGACETGEAKFRQKHGTNP